MEQKFKFEFPKSDVSLIVDSLASFEEMMLDTADSYKKSRTDSYYKFWAYQAKQAGKLRKTITESTGIDQSTIEDYAVAGDAFNTDH